MGIVEMLECCTDYLHSKILYELQGIERRFLEGGFPSGFDCITDLDWKGIDDPSRIESMLLKELHKFDLSLIEVRVLWFLITKGNASAAEISRHTRIQRTETYNCISALLNMGIVFSTFDRPQRYHALSINELHYIASQTKEDAKASLAEKKREHERQKESFTTCCAVNADSVAGYEIVDGNDSVSAKIKRMLGEAKEEVCILITDRFLLSLHQAGITEQLVNLALKGVRVTLRPLNRRYMDYSIAEGETNSSLRPAESFIPVNFVLVDSKRIVRFIDL